LEFRISRFNSAMIYVYVLFDCHERSGKYHGTKEICSVTVLAGYYGRVGCHFPSLRAFFKGTSCTLKINLRALLYCNLALLSRMRLLLRVHGFWL
jgi:hypothetical protein